MKPKKSLAQYFLKDTQYLHRIASTLKIDGECVVEVGAGEGAITNYLIEQAAKLYLVEFDARLAQDLTRRYQTKSTVEVIQEDILRLDLSSLDAGQGLVVVGSIPYYISNDLIHHLVRNRRLIKRAYLGLQKEFAEKLTATCSTKAYSFISCYLQYFAEVKVHFTIPNTAYRPIPKVDSCFVEFAFYPAPVYVCQDEKVLFALIRAAFSLRRKKIINSLQQLYPKERLITALSELSLDPSSRPQDIALSDYCRLTNTLLAGV